MRIPGELSTGGDRGNPEEIREAPEWWTGPFGDLEEDWGGLKRKDLQATVLRWCRGKHNTFNRTKRVKLTPSPALVYIIGAYFGDASVTEIGDCRYSVKLKAVDRVFAEALKEIGLAPR